MSKCNELSDRDRDLLLIRRSSGAKTTQLAQMALMEKMLQQTKSLMKTTEADSESKDCGDVMVTDLEEKVLRSRKECHNSLHRTLLLGTQMKTAHGKLIGTLDHLQELRNKLQRSQQNAEEREAAMQKLATGLR